MAEATATGRRVPTTTVLAIFTVTLAAWSALLVWGDGGSNFATYVLGWTVMMVAMMLPSASPFVLLYRVQASGAATSRLATGYLTVWALTGVVAWALRDVAMGGSAAVVLAVAGVYQLTPAKRACLRRCRSAADFLVQHWRPNAFVLGAHHGLYCLGCCWALMAVLVAAGMMSLAWVLAIALVVAAEKLVPRGQLFATFTGVAMLALAVIEVTTTVEVRSWM